MKEILIVKCMRWNGYLIVLFFIIDWTQLYVRNENKDSTPKIVAYTLCMYIFQFNFVTIIHTYAHKKKFIF